MRACEVCTSADNVFIHAQRFEGMENDLLRAYNVVACRRCGFCFATDIPEQDTFDSYYEEMSKYEVAESPYDVAKAERAASLIEQLCPKNAAVLEIGCATGGLLAALRKRGYADLYGIDPSAKCVEAARRYGDVSQATLGAFDGSGFDVVILMGVLEHIRDLTAVCEKLAGFLSGSGVLVVGVPDASRYTNGEDAPFQEFSVEHINFFGPKSLVNLLTKHGFAEIHRVQAVVECNHRTRTPVLYSFFQKAAAPPALEVDADTPSELASYVATCAASDQVLIAKIGRLASTGQSFFVWGAGSHTRRLLSNGKLSQVKIRAFVDSNSKYHGRSLGAVPVVSPTELSYLPNHPIIVSSRAFQKEIVATIRATLTNEAVTLYDL